MNFDRIIPLLVYRDIQAAHDFLVVAFGFASGGIERTPEGQVVHAEVRAGDAIIWLHQVADNYSLDTPAHTGTSGGGLVIHVSDVDAHYTHALAAGAKIGYAPTDQPYGQREYEARDPEGHYWWFATPTGANGG